ncbi:hypothetical protein SAMN06265365_108172 [Tistlia consotensis]|uniref:Uncharacterized protein n=1 Tax=Tistlia consotensis USBA 355 TaxID=560819 RepID=A0A1Y6BSX4_9PROT|nr:hypothetical protein [Tistlia consotensis]SMF23418.1 hypothetical protein SAMN05428998_1088 [Tistlia consotensis USBA 355]SNR61679.1 hypothetical protein SAMN06265365_108172 [Tistlia consotensis]
MIRCMKARRRPDGRPFGIPDSAHDWAVFLTGLAWGAGLTALAALAFGVPAL